MGGPPARFGSGQFGRTQARSGGEGGGGGVGHPNPNAPVGYPPRMPWPPLVGPPGGAGNPPPPAAVKGAKPIPARDPVTGKVVGHWFVGRLDEQGNYCPSCPLAWHYKPSFGSGSMPGTNI
jgi:hypothetical protein